VRLAGKLVLVDTPGLHSMTPENAALTQRFTDSADGVLWLTSSTSPGQVQELDELGRELHRNKPLLPVVTRSDVYEEDEIDGEIRKRLRNKTAANRAEQEDDVRTRAQDKLVAMGVDIALLKAPVSVSSHLAREQQQTQDAMHDAGFEKLYAALIAIIEPTLAYKRRKQAEVFLHHLEENVMGMLCREVLASIDALRSSSEAALASLDKQREQIASAVWRRIVPTLPALLDAHRETTLSRSVFEAFRDEANKQLGDYIVAPAHVEFDDVIDGADYHGLQAALVKVIRRLSGDVIEPCKASIEQLTERAAQLRSLLHASETDLVRLKERLRSEFE
jgi:hypothetical protein